MLLHKKTVDQNQAAAFGDSDMRVYSAILNQTSTSNPTILEIKNTIGITPTIVRPGFFAGIYELTFTGGLFLIDKTIILMLNGSFSTPPGFIAAQRNSDEVFLIQTFNSSGIPVDDILTNASLLITLYN